ncbi:PTS system mannose/fructose/sorbose family transporter subunit IID [Lacrimispora saccharolytica]|uniref:PTS system mannose/fructose/sorbose family IID component n=1 Tax=Lacrimispora saccharolytica (strain ATCC 35040 / DSM 2544 / NRCC 2533 / WM1) TaxID=610130 RepID=D9R866_LACSW|nr:PTS system mannose/fructose/sorbose family transporter subunit IID [Lacrimispora saccharolytica]ADL03818.1 PTS system mannose/fructose/sorbose family IID component [[Clostridium] saccharolyticum WM1]QRV21865.1 PTS system mannose/fructose/sorbose family transporter subunit IID [Lacrimispora saccharolytica]
MADKNQTGSVKLEKSDIIKVYLRNLFTLQFGWNYEKMQGLGYAYVIMPVLKRLYSNDPEKMKRALKMHLGYFNTTPAMSHLIVGADMALEEELGIEAEEAITGLKTGLMGPFAGVGDTLFIAIYRAIVFSIASYIAMQGNPIGLIIPLIACGGVLWIRYKFTTIGYQSGRKLATGFADKISPITEAASILGLTVVGALIPSVIKYRTDLQFTMGEVTFALQDMLDKIMPSLLPLGIVVFSYWLLGKKKVNSTKLIFILIGLGMVLGNLQSMLTFVAGLF